MRKSRNLLCELFEGLGKLGLRRWCVLVFGCGHDGTSTQITLCIAAALGVLVRLSYEQAYGHWEEGFRLLLMAIEWPNKLYSISF